jgi:hypothetical protein
MVVGLPQFHHEPANQWVRLLVILEVFLTLPWIIQVHIGRSICESFPSVQSVDVAGFFQPHENGARKQQFRGVLALRWRTECCPD